MYYTTGPGCHVQSSEREFCNMWIQAPEGDYAQPCAEAVTGASACYWSALKLPPAPPLLPPIPQGKPLKLSSLSEHLILFLFLKRLSISQHEAIKDCFSLGGKLLIVGKCPAIICFVGQTTGWHPTRLGHFPLFYVKFEKKTFLNYTFNETFPSATMKWMCSNAVIWQCCW